APRRVQEELEAALAREQTLRWRVGQLEREVAALLARPVDVWEAENAALQARLAELEAERGEPVDATEEAAEPPADAVDPANGSGAAGEPARSPMPRGRTPGWGATAGGQYAKTQRAVLKVVDGLVRRIERGGIGTLQLRRELVQLPAGCRRKRGRGGGRTAPRTEGRRVGEGGGNGGGASRDEKLTKTGT